MGEYVFDTFADEFGPEKVCYITEPGIGLKGIAVVDNTAAGPAIGGIRMAPDVTTEEVFRLARGMTWKNAMAGLSHGGGKSCIIADPKSPNKEALVRHFARGIANLTGYIPGPDMGTDETCMAWVRDEIGRSVGLSPVLGGIPLDEVGATGYGVAIAGEVIQDFTDVRLDGATVSIQGYGNVGQHAARFLVERGAILTIVADLDGTLYDPKGIDDVALTAWIREKGGLTGFEGGEHMPMDAFLDLECDIFVPAARPDVVDEKTAHRLKCKVILEGANIPCTAGAEKILHERGILDVPDFVANAGGVICAAVEYHGGTKKVAFDTIEEKVRENTAQVLEVCKRTGQMPRDAALGLAEQRVKEAMSYRRST